MPDDGIIDLSEYLRRRPGGRRGTFAVWGGDGEKSRFALPVWRAIYLVGGERGGIVWAPERGGSPSRLTSYFVLDISVEPARTAFDADLAADIPTDRAPSLGDRPGGVAVFLGAANERRWYMLVDDGGRERAPLGGRERDDLLFLAGECAGLLFFRQLARDEDE